MNTKYFFLLILLIPFIVLSQNQAYAVNTVTNIIKIEVSLAGGVQNEDFILPESVSNMSKTMIFLSARHIGDSNEKEVYRSWELINSTAIRFYGSSNVPASNDAISFTGYIVEFSNASDMFSQTNSLTVAGGLSNQEFTDLFGTAVNTTSSFFQFMGQTANHADLTWGREELARMRIINSSGFGYEPFDAPNSGDTIVRYQIIDLDDPNVLVQRGNVTMLEGTELSTVTPPTAINGSRTLLFASHNTNGELDADADEQQFTARIDGSNNLEFDRDDATCGTPLCDLRIRWEAITFLDGSVYVQYRQFDDTIATGANVQQTGVVNFTSTPVNASRSIAIGTVHTPLGLGQGRTSSAPTGGFDRLAYTVELIDNDTVDVVTNDGSSIADIWFQVVEFLPVGQTFTKSITDSTTVTDQVRKTIGKKAVDFSTFVDLSTGNTVIRGGTDVVSVSDLTNKNTTKGQNETSSVTDTTTKNTTKVQTETGTVTDTTTKNTTKVNTETSTITDTTNKNTTKVQTDTVSVSDVVIPLTVFVVRVNDTGTVIDMVNMNITKKQSDVAGIFENINLNTTKIFLDSAVVFDSTQLTKSSNASPTDTTTQFDNLRLNVTKLIQDATTVNDNVIVMRLLDLKINDTVIVNDPSIQFYLATIPPTGTPPSGGGGGGTPTLQRIVGLSITSEFFHVKAGDEVPSDFIIMTFGQETDTVTLTNIVPTDAFISWFKYSPFPDPLEFNIKFDSSRPISDPARVTNTALDNFVLTVPNIECKNLTPFDTPTPCIEKKIYEAPMIFTFKKGGVEFREKHIVKIDATDIIECDLICKFEDFITHNYYWLAGIIIMFMVLYFGTTIVRGKKVRVFTRIDRNYFTSSRADQPRKKFKRGKR